MRRNKHNMHKTRRAIAVLFFLAMSLTMKAQVFMIDGDENYREPEDPQVFINLPSNYGDATDWYGPIGEGLLLLTALSGAYLYGKREKENKYK